MLSYVFAPMVVGSLIIDATSRRLSATSILLTSMLVVDMVSKRTKQ